MKKRKRNKQTKKIGGWLLVLLLDLFVSGLIMSIFFLQRVIAILSSQATLGVYISTCLLFFYELFIGITIFKILTKKKSAIKTFIITAIVGAIFVIWYYLLSSLIYHQFSSEQMVYNWINVIFNIALTVVMAIYLIKSKRVKKTLIK